MNDHRIKSVILTLVGNVTVRPAKMFTAREFFNVNTKRNASVAISYLGDDFIKWFLSKTEERLKDKVGLHYHDLNKNSLDAPIFRELGGETKVETNLAEIAALMKKQAHGEPGALVIDDYANIFYVRNVNGVVYAVCVYWRGRGWNVFTSSVKFPFEWDAGYRVFSRDS